MNAHTAMRISAVFLAFSLAALVSDIGVYLLHIHLAPKIKGALDVLAFVWPLALVFFGTYQRKVQAEAAHIQSPPA
jgi:hypothetical protein